MASGGENTDFGFSGAIQSVKDAAGFTNGGSAVGTVPANPGILPWNISDASGTPSVSIFYPPIKIDTSRWDQLYPYRLVVVDSTTNKVVNGLYNFKTGQRATRDTIAANGGVTVDFTPMNGDWVFQLPISPQQLNITDQFAINTTATLRGVLEEHNGVKFKMINCSGTMGVWAYRESVTKPPTTPGVLQSVFGGTIGALGNVFGSVNSLANAATGKHPAENPTTIFPEFSQAGPESTGYYTAMLLQQFLEQYAEAKKRPEAASWRLVFDIPKQNTSYVVTPVQYVWQQSVNKPMEILYTFQLKAWRRIDLKEQVSQAFIQNTTVSPGILQQILNTITAARQVMSASLGLIAAVRSDVETPLNILRQTALFVKDLVGVGISAADLPSQIAKDYKSSIAQSINILKDSIASANNDPHVAAALAAVVAGTTAVEGLSIGAVSAGQIGNQATINQALNPASVVLNDPNANFSLLDAVPVSSMALTTSQQQTVNEIVQSASQISVATLKQYRSSMLQLCLQLSNNFGAGSAYYDKVYNLPPPIVRILPMTLSEYDILKSLYDVLQAYDILTATTVLDDQNIQTAMDYVAGLAATSGIEFQTDTSKQLVPVPHGKTIEEIAIRYLGDPQRWLEIVTLNGLKEPYIDETGFKYYLLSNALGREIIINNDTNLYLGQTVLIQSATQMPSARTILQISPLSATSFLITLDGLPNLDNFTIADRAYLQAYLPGTVNSQQKIYIPSLLPPPNDFLVIPPPNTTSDPLTGLSKVDWLLTDSGDIATTQYGDFRYSSGMTNIIQALRIKFSTEVGKWIMHPNFGLSIVPGLSFSDLDMNKLYNNINNLVTQDPRFSKVTNLQVTFKNNALTISLGVVLAGQNGVFPITFALT